MIRREAPRRLGFGEAIAKLRFGAAVGEDRVDGPAMREQRRLPVRDVPVVAERAASGRRREQQRRDRADEPGSRQALRPS
jgi:hypothetical protein